MSSFATYNSSAQTGTELNRTTPTCATVIIHFSPVPARYLPVWLADYAPLNFALFMSRLTASRCLRPPSFSDESRDSVTTRESWFSSVIRDSQRSQPSIRESSETRLWYICIFFSSFVVLLFLLTNIERSIKKFVRKLLMGNIESWKNSEFINVQIKKVCIIFYFIYIYVIIFLIIFNNFRLLRSKFMDN